MRPAVLKRIVCFAQVLDAVVKRHDTGDFLAHFPAIFTAEFVCLAGAGGPSHLEQNLPLCFGFADLPRDLRAEGNPALGRCLDATVVLLVARLGREQQHAILARLDKHLVGQHDVLMHP